MTIQAGKYQHYKGAMYEVYYTVQHSETEEWMVVYKSLYGDRGIWVRPYDMFVSEVEIEGKRIPRFSYMPLA